VSELSLTEDGFARRWASALVCLCVVTTTLHESFAATATDKQAPRVIHTIVQKGVIGQALELRVTLQDQSEIFDPKLYFRKVGELEYTAVDLTSAGAKGEYKGTIPATFVTRDLEYFLESFDALGNGPGRNGSPERPHAVKVSTRSDDSMKPMIVQPAQTSSTQTAALATQTVATPTPYYKTGWFWTVVGVGAAALIATAVLVPLAVAGKFDPPPSNFDQVTILVKGVDPRTGL
jgi:hypothetical protein